MRKIAGLLAFSCVLVAASFAQAGLQLRINGSTNPTINLGPGGATQQLQISILGTLGAFPDDLAVPTLSNFDFQLQISNAAAARISAISFTGVPNLTSSSSSGVNTALGRVTGTITPDFTTSPAITLATFTIQSLTLSNDVQTSITLRDPDLGNAGNFRASNGISTATLDRDAAVFTGAGGVSTSSVILNVAAVPEPSSMLLLATAGVVGLRFRRRLSRCVS